MLIPINQNREIVADRVILPEQEIGIRLADNLSSPFTDIVRLAKNFSISQIVAPKKFIGQTLQELQFFDTYKVQCIGVKKGDKIILINPDYVIAEDDKLIFAGNNEHLEVIAKL